MGKLSNLKEWLTVADAARQLSIVFGEEVTEADVLRLGLEERLRLSVYFVNHATALRAEWIPFEEHTELVELTETVNKMTGRESVRTDEEKLHPVLRCDDQVVTLTGVWDLPMIGGERLDIEQQYQMLTCGPAVTLQNLDGAFVEGQDDQIYQLQEDYDDNDYQAGSSAKLKRLKQHIASNGIKNAEAELLLNRHKEQRKVYLERRRAKPEHENYYPAGSLPKDAVLVVRTEALREFEQSVNGVPKGAEKPISTTERNTLLTIIAALCDYSAINPDDRGAAGQIAKLTEEVGATVSDDTVRRWLKAIPPRPKKPTGWQKSKGSAGTDKGKSGRARKPNKDDFKRLRTAVRNWMPSSRPGPRQRKSRLSSKMSCSESELKKREIVR